MTDGPVLSAQETMDVLAGVFGYVPWWWLRQYAQFPPDARSWEDDE